MSEFTPSPAAAWLEELRDKADDAHDLASSAATPADVSTAEAAANSYTDSVASELAVSIRRYGAQGDGTTDDATAIQDTIDAVSSAGGGIVRVPAGDYRVSTTIKLASNIHLEGVGESSILRPTDSLSGFGGSNTLIRLDRHDGPYEDVEVRDLKVAGPVDTEAPRSGHGILLQRVTGVRVRRVTVTEASDAAIRIDGYGEGTFVDDPESPFWANTFDATVEDCRLTGSYLGLELEGGVTRAKILNNEVWLTESHGIRLPSAYEVELDNNRMRDIGHSCYYFDRSSDIKVRGGQIESVRGSMPVAFNLAGVDSLSVDDVTIIAGVVTDDVTGNASNHPNGLTLRGVTSRHDGTGDACLLNHSTDVLAESCDFPGGVILDGATGVVRNDRRDAEAYVRQEDGPPVRGIPASNFKGIIGSPVEAVWQFRAPAWEFPDGSNNSIAGVGQVAANVAAVDVYAELYVPSTNTGTAVIQLGYADLPGGTQPSDGSVWTTTDVPLSFNSSQNNHRRSRRLLLSNFTVTPGRLLLFRVRRDPSGLSGDDLSGNVGFVSLDLVPGT